MDEHPPRRSRQEWKRAYRSAHVELSRILFEEDPMGLAKAGCPPDEYGLEVGSILVRLPGCESAAEVLVVLTSEFSAWFGPGAVDSPARYGAASDRIWRHVVPLFQVPE